MHALSISKLTFQKPGRIIVDRTKDGRVKPINPLAWWHAQRVAGNEWDGVTQMALDVLSTPGMFSFCSTAVFDQQDGIYTRSASSVDVERAFSFAGTIVAKRRHNLAPASIQATASLGSYSKAGLVKPGSLVLPRKGKGKAKAATTTNNKT